MALSKIDPNSFDVNSIGQYGGRRNLIINGAMQVAQRGTGAIQASNSTYPTIDRFKFFLNGGGAYTVEQVSGHQADTGHDKAIKIAVTTADTSIAAGDYYSFLQRIESNSVQHLQYGTSSAKSVTLSFWVRATKTGTHTVHFAKQGSGTDYRYVKEYTISASDTWEYKTITIPGLTAATITNDASTYFQVGWILKYGSDYQGTKDIWTTSGTYTTAAAVNNMDSTSNTFYITGVQLEVGSVATPFEHRLYGEELSLCQRYFYAKTREGSGSNHLLGMSYWSSTTSNECVLQHPVQMRTSPTVSVDTIGDFYGLIPQQAWQQASGVSLNEGGPNTTKVTFTCSSNGSFSVDGRRSSVIGIRGDSGRLKVDAEL